jgi:hypothetical protein
MRASRFLPIILSAATPVLAQGEELYLAPEKSKWITGTIALVLLVAAVIVSVMSSKRSHRD